MILSDQ